jgi:putative chitinase
VRKSRFYIGYGGFVYIRELTYNYQYCYRMIKLEDLTMITYEQLKAIMPFSIKQKLVLYVDPLNEATREFDINTRLRVCAFLAQVAHESCSLVYTHELATGEEYEGRKDLGNTSPGDGVRYKGRGPLQITGKYNYRDCGKALGLDLVSKPELLETPENGCKSSAWFWKTKGLNELADKGDFKEITHRINGGYKHYDSRLSFYNKALEVIK